MYGNNTFSGDINVYTCKWFRNENAGYGLLSVLSGNQPGNNTTNAVLAPPQGTSTCTAASSPMHWRIGAGQVGNVIKNTLNFESSRGIVVNCNNTPSPSNSASFTFTNVQRQNNGVLVLASQNNSLGAYEQILTTNINNAAAANSITNGMLPPYLLVSNGGLGSPGGTPAAFATYGSNGFIPATATSTSLTTPARLTS